MDFIAMDLAVSVISQLRPIVPIHPPQRPKHGRSNGRGEHFDRLESRRRQSTTSPRCQYDRDRKYLFTVASGSAEEVRTALRVSIAKGNLKEKSAEKVLDDIDQLQAILWKLMR